MLNTIYFEFCEFGEENFQKWLCYGSDTFKTTRDINYHVLTKSELKKKQIYSVLYDYLNDDKDSLDATHMLIEKDYISKAYVSDYQNFYSRYHNKIPKNVIRIHFFRFKTKTHRTSTLNINNIKQLYNKVLKEENKDNYLGYMVIRPVPNATIGATLLKTFNETCKRGSSTKKRNYLCTRSYKINILGRQINEFKTMAFMEQDTAVGACSTFALWSGLNVLCNKFELPILTPSEITKISNTGRTNKDNLGLSAEQISQGLEKIGFRTEVIDFNKNKNSNKNKKSNKKLKNNAFYKVIFAYLNIGIPIFAVNSTKSIDKENKEIYHLICINGFRNDYTAKGMKKITSIDKLYAHDDRIGPFCSYSLDEKDKENDNIKFKSPWKNKEFYLESLIIALPNEIKVTYSNITNNLNELIRYSHVFEESISAYVKLINSNDYKQDLINKKIINEVLLKNLPKYIWVLKVYGNRNKELFHLIYDTEDPTNKHIPLVSYIIDDKIKKTITEINNMSIKVVEDENLEDSVVDISKIKIKNKTINELINSNNASSLKVTDIDLNELKIKNEPYEIHVFDTDNIKNDLINKLKDYNYFETEEDADLKNIDIKYFKDKSLSKLKINEHYNNKVIVYIMYLMYVHYLDVNAKQYLHSIFNPTLTSTAFTNLLNKIH